MSDPTNEPVNEPAPAPADDTTLVTGADDAPNVDDQPKADDAPAADDAPKGDDDQPKADDDDAPKGDDDDSADEGAPEAYADFAMPDGIEIDTELADEFKSVAKELNLSQDKAQKVIDLAAKMRERDVEAIINLRAEWVDQTKTDPEIGGDKLDANLAVAKKAVDAYGSPAFVQLLNESGLGNHPEFVRFCVKAGKPVSETGVVRGNADGTPTDKPLHDRIYHGTK